MSNNQKLLPKGIPAQDMDVVTQIKDLDNISSTALGMTLKKQHRFSTRYNTPVEYLDK